MEQLNNSNIIISILSAIGMTFIITQSYLFKGLRKYCKKKNKWLCKLVTCSLCCSFHCAWINIIGLLFIPYFIIFQISCISSIATYTLYLLLVELMRKYDK